MSDRVPARHLHSPAGDKTSDRRGAASQPAYARLEALWKSQSSGTVDEHPALVLAIGVVCATVAFIASLAQNLNHAGSYATTLIFDSGHYLATTQSLTCHVLSFLRHQPFATVAGPLAPAIDPNLTRSLILDGPLLPGLGTVLFTLIGKIPSTSDASVFIVMETAFHAISAALVFALANRFTSKPLLGGLAGLTWAIYPSALLACNAYLSELPCVAVHLWFVYVLSNVLATKECKFTLTTACFSAGLMIGLCLISRPVASTFIVPTIIAASFLRRDRAMLKAAAAMACGILPVIALWSLFTFSSTNVVLPTAVREPTGNIAKGANVISDGWGVSPSAPIQEMGKPYAPLVKAWKTSPLDSANLLLRKPERIWINPWNSYREACLRIPVELQLWFHRLLLISGITGLFAMIACWSGASVQIRFISLSIAAAICGHFSYVFFETQSRYGFPAMPFVILSAVFGLYAAQRSGALKAWGATISLGCLCAIACVADSSANATQTASNAVFTTVSTLLARTFLMGLFLGSARRLFRTTLVTHSTDNTLSKCLLAVLLVLTCGSLVAHVTNRYSINEWRWTIKNGQSISRRIGLPLTATRPDFALLIVDGDRNIAGATIEVNGHALSEPLEQIYVFDSEHYQVSQSINVLASLQKKDMGTIRQWRATPVPLSILNFGGTNAISLACKAPTKRLTVYGSNPPVFSGEHPLPSLQYVSLGKVLQDVSGQDVRLPDIDTMRGPMTWNNTDSSIKRPGECRIYLLFGYPNQSTDVRRQSTQPMPPTAGSLVQESITRLPPSAIGRDGVLHINGVKTLTIPIDVQAHERSHIRIAFCGQLRATRAPETVAIDCQPIDGDGAPPLIPYLNQLLEATPQWTRFQLLADVPATLLAKREVSAIKLRVLGSKHNAEVLLRDVELKLVPKDLPLFSHKRIEVH